MRAVQAAERGGYEALRVVDIPQPQRQAGHALVQVTSAGVTPLDRTVLAGLHPRHLVEDRPFGKVTLTVDAYQVWSDAGALLATAELVRRQPRAGDNPDHARSNAHEQ